jgi:hypothetical protein
MGFSTTFLAASGLVAAVSGHMLLASPTPYALVGATLSNSPLDANGDNFPCKLGSGITLDTSKGVSNTYALGSTGNKLAFTGEAVHGGGSCQISLTTDAQPNSNSKWKTIYSIEGGCPAQGEAGNLGADNDASAADPYTYSFDVPSDIPAGNYTLAWTWFRLSPA